jgi:hypothetical protein
MKTRKQVVIFDDDDGRRQDWVEALEKVPGFSEGFETLRVEKSTFRKGLEELRRRRQEARRGSESAHSGTFFDEASILLVDYDLFDLPGDASETGEEVAYLARCFSKCGMIVAINQFARESFTFDLTLQGHPESFADLNLLDDQIFNAGLWCTPWGEFRPWYWPHLPKAVEDLEQRVSEVEANLDEKVLDFLKIPSEVREIFPLTALTFIASEGNATFRQFVEVSGKTLRHNDKVVSEESFSRVAAARLSKCLERLVLPGQNILVDAAHLLERYPSLFLADSPERLIGWTQIHELLEPGESLMDVEKVKGCRFARSAWLSRAAWYWPQVSECEQVKEVVDPWASRQELASTLARNDPLLLAKSDPGRSVLKARFGCCDTLLSQTGANRARVTIGPGQGCW